MAYGGVDLTRSSQDSAPFAYGPILVNFLVFFSGVVHALVTLRLGFRCGHLAGNSLVCANFVRITVEDGVQWAASKTFEVQGRCQFVHRMIGCMWVFSFFCSVLKWLYPKVYCGKD